MDDVVVTEMKSRGIVGVSIAIIEDGEIFKAKGYGFTDKSAGTRVTTDTLFQAGSISKPVAALAALQMVEDGVLSLDEDVNRKSKGWQVPAQVPLRVQHNRANQSQGLRQIGYLPSPEWDQRLASSQEYRGFRAGRTLMVPFVGGLGISA